jgi:hypothetical protein
VIQRIVFDATRGEVRTQVFDGALPIGGASSAFQAGLIVAHPDPPTERHLYAVLLADGGVHEADESGRPFSDKRSAYAFEDRMVKERLLRRPPDSLPGLPLEWLAARSRRGGETCEGSPKPSSWRLSCGPPADVPRS